MGLGDNPCGGGHAGGGFGAGMSVGVSTCDGYRQGSHQKWSVARLSAVQRPPCEAAPVRASNLPSLPARLRYSSCGAPQAFRVVLHGPQLEHDSYIDGDCTGGRQLECQYTHDVSWLNKVGVRRWRMAGA